MQSSQQVVINKVSNGSGIESAEFLVENFKQLFLQLDASNCHTGLKG